LAARSRFGVWVIANLAMDAIDPCMINPIYLYKFQLKPL
jgi:hypothetical protein